MKTPPRLKANGVTLSFGQFRVWQRSTALFLIDPWHERCASNDPAGAMTSRPAGAKRGARLAGAFGGGWTSSGTPPARERAAASCTQSRRFARREPRRQSGTLWEKGFSVRLALPE